MIGKTRMWTIGMAIIISFVTVQLPPSPPSIIFSSSTSGSRVEDTELIWIEIGKDSAEGGGVSKTDYSSTHHNLAIDPDGYPVLVWKQYINEGKDDVIYLKRFNGSTWEEVGSSASGEGLSTPYSDSTYPNVVVDGNGFPIVAWAQYLKPGKAIYIRKYNGSEWVEVGTGSASDNGVGNATIDYPALAIKSDDNPIVAFKSIEGDFTHIVVKNFDGTSWNQLGQNADLSEGENLHIPSLALDGNEYPFVAWSTGIYFSATDQIVKQIYLKYFDGTQWNGLAGSAMGGGISNNSGESYFSTHGLAIDSNNYPVVAWYNYFNDKPYIYTKRFDGTSWVEIGEGSATGVGISNGITACHSNLSVILDHEDNPLIFWLGCDGPSGEMSQFYVSQFDGSNWTMMEFPGGDTNPGVGNLVLGNDEFPIVSWEDTGNEPTRPSNANRQIYILKANPPDNTPPQGSVGINYGTTTNQGAIHTTSSEVILSISAHDSSGVRAYRLGTDGVNFGNWLEEWDEFTYTAKIPSQLQGVDGEKAVYIQFEDKASNISDIYSDTIILDSSLGSDFGISINNGAIWTNQVSVTLGIPAQAGTAEMQISNDGGFANAVLEPYSLYKAWEITSYGSYVIPRVVYVRFKDINGNISTTFQDDIILDVNAPTGSVEVEAGVSENIPETAKANTTTMRPVTITANGGYSNTIYLPLVLNGFCSLPTGPANVTLHLQAEDDVSGVADMMISHLPECKCGTWESYSATKAWYVPAEATTIYVKFRDHAGNVSEVVTDTIPGSVQ